MTLQFNGSTTGQQVVERLTREGVTCEGRVIFITGTTHGIGMETARAFASVKGPNVTLVLANRNVEASQALGEELKKNGCEGFNVHHLKLDLSDLSSVRACAESFLELGLPLHYLVLNAGIFSADYGETKQGYERHFGINHLGHFLLTSLLLPKLEETGTEEAMARVVVVASHSHYPGVIDFNDLPLKKETFGNVANQKAYAQSKLCNVLFASELNRRLVAGNKNVRAYSLHPASMTGSNIGDGSVIVRASMRIASLFTRSLQQACATTITCALSPQLEGKGGGYYDKCSSVEPSKTAADEEVAKKLWQFSEELCAKHAS